MKSKMSLLMSFSLSESFPDNPPSPHFFHPSLRASSKSPFLSSPPPASRLGVGVWGWGVRGSGVLISYLCCWDSVLLR